MNTSRLFVLLAGFLATSLAASAHNPGLSTLQLEAGPDRLFLTLQLTPPDLDADGRSSPEESAAATELLRRHTPTWLGLADTGAPLVFTGEAPELRPAEEIVVWRATARLPEPGRLTLRLSHLDLLGSGHREFVTFSRSGETLAAGLLSAENPSLEFILAPSSDSSASAGAAGATAPTLAGPSRKAPFADFFRLGVAHILIGYDHLLYLAALILGCPRLTRPSSGSRRHSWPTRLRAVLPIVTAFTLAHSFTLALAVFGLVRPPSAVIEPVIAASIMLVAAENLWLRGREPRRRWAAALGFGFVHGFGFAGLLGELLGPTLMPGGVAVPLLAFNLGVEAGQLLVLALVLPVLAWAARRPAFVHQGLPAASALVAAFGLFWFVERIWF